VKLRGWVAPLAVLATLSLAGCGAGLTPGTAAVVDGQRITIQQVDDLVAAQCSAADAAAKGGSSSPMPLSDVRRRSLGLLMDTALSKKYAADQHITPDHRIADALYGQFEGAIQQLPATARDRLSTAFKDWAVGRAILVQAGSAQTGQAPKSTNLEQLINAGLTERDAWQEKVTIHTDPRFSPAKNGFPGGGDGSVSRPTSTFAKATVAKNVDPAWVGGLPASQKCG